MDNEIRSVPTDLKVVQRDDTGKPKQIQGYAIMFNEESEYLGEQFYEIIKPGALDDVDLSQVQLLYGHETNSILARCDAGSLKLKIDDKGLFFVATLADTTLANDVYNDILAGNLKGCSFAFTTGVDSWSRTEEGTALHIITTLNELFEITITPRPAYQETSVAVKRSLDKIRKEKRDTMNIDPKQLADLIAQALAAQTEPADDKQDKPAPDAQRDDDSVEDVPDNGDSTDGGSDDSEETEERSEDAQKEDKPDKGKDTNHTPEDDTDDPTASEDVADDKGSEEQVDGDSEDEPEDDNKAQKETKKMPKVINKPENNERSNFKSFLKRDLSITSGTTASDNSLALPHDILKPIERPANTNSLISLANIISVSAPSGTVPVMSATDITLATAEELAQNPQIAKMQLEGVDYKLKTKRGYIPVSQEFIDDADADVNVDALIGDYATQIRDNTLVADIAGVLKKATSATVTSFDDVKKAKNGLFKYSNISIVATKSAYDAFDTLKDNEGRYLLQDSIVSPSGKQLLGAPVYVVEDKVLGATEGDQMVFIGDIKSFTVVPLFKDLRAKWVDNDVYGEKLQLVLRDDAQVADKEAGKLLTLNFTAPAPAQG